MIIYDLKCSNNHQFESWFKNNEFFEDQRKSKKINCPFCESIDINIVFSPLRILKNNTKDTITKSNVEPEQTTATTHTKAKDFKQLQKIANDLQKELVKHCDYVGKNFAEEARKIHYGEKKTERGIYGETTKNEMNALKEEGIDFLTVPIRKTNA